MIEFNTNLYGTENSSKANNKHNHKRGRIKYCHTSIPANDILCVREVPDSYIYPKSMITIREKNPADDETYMITEYEYMGSKEQWLDAIERADKAGDSVNFNAWA